MEIHCEDHVVGVFEQFTVSFLAVAKSLLGPFALGDVFT